MSLSAHWYYIIYGETYSFNSNIFNLKQITIVYFSSAILFCATVLGIMLGPDLECKRNTDISKAT